MIELIKGLPDGVVGIQAIGEVDSADYKTTATPEVRHALERHPKIRLIHVLDDRFTGYTAGGAWQDALIGLAHPRSLERIAVVTDSESHPSTREPRRLVDTRRTEVVPQPRARASRSLGERRAQSALTDSRASQGARPARAHRITRVILGPTRARSRHRQAC